MTDMRVFIGLIVVVPFACGAAPPCEQLKPAVKIERAVASRAGAVFCLLAAEPVLRVRVEQKGRDLSLRLDCDGQEPVNADEFGDGPESITAVGDAGRRCRLTVQPTSVSFQRAEFELRYETGPHESGDDTRRKAEERSTRIRNAIAEQKYSDPETMLPELNEAAQLWAQADDLRGFSNALIVAGNFLHRLRRDEEAVPLYDRGLDAARLAGDVRSVAEALNNKGLALLQAGRFEPAMEALKAAIPLWTSIRRDDGIAAGNVNLGLLSWETGEFQDALNRFGSARATFESRKDRRALALTLNNMALVYASLNQPRAAERDLRQAIALFDPAKDTAAIARARVNAAYVNLENERPAAAIPYLRAALRILGSSKDQRSLADAEATLGWAFRETGHAEEALRFLNQAKARYEETRDLRGQAYSLHHLGLTLAKQGRREEALAALHEARLIRTRISLPQVASESLFEIARIELESGEADAARHDLLDVVNELETTRNRIAGEGFRSSFFAGQQKRFDLLISLLSESGETERAFEIAERVRQRAFLDVLGARRWEVLRDADQESLTKLQAAQRRLDFRAAALSSSVQTESELAKMREEFDAARTEYERMIAELRSSSPKVARFSEPPAVSAAAIRSALGGRLLLEYRLNERNSTIWLVTGEAIESYTIPSRGWFEGRIRETLELAGDYSGRMKEEAREKRFEKLLSELRWGLLAPIAKRIRGQKLLIVPDGMIAALPWALLAPGASEAVSLPAGSLLARDTAKGDIRGDEGRLLFAAIGDPVFDSFDSRVEADSHLKKRAGLPRLPFSPKEFSRITGLAPPTRTLVLTSFDASKAALMNRSSIRRAKILDISTHLVLDAVDPSLTHLALSQVDKGGRSVDGNVYLFEISSVEIGADVVILAACQSAVGPEVRGEGLASLAQVFLYAGAKQVLVSSWPVDGEATAELTRQFCRYVMGGASPAAALKMAQQGVKTRSGWSDPKYWAGFQIVGLGSGV